MDPEQREILIARRVELVEDIDIQGGLFTQLLSRKILLKRAVNKIRLNRTPEEQVEELLNELPKRECFEDFCDALIADGQEHIVKKYLKTPLPAAVKPKATEPVATPAQAAPVLSCSVPAATPNEGSSAESTDSCVSVGQTVVKRAHPPTSSSTAVLCIREEDSQHLYITYTDDGVPPEKRKKALEARIPSSNTVVSALAAPVAYEPDETRYSMKHYVSQEIGHPRDNSLSSLPEAIVLNNPQSILKNSNISDPLRYAAAFPVGQPLQTVTQGFIASSPSSPTDPRSLISSVHSSSSLALPSEIPNTAKAASSPLFSPLKDPSSLVNKQEMQDIHIRHLLQSQRGGSFIDIDQFKAARSGGFASPGMVWNKFQDPQQYLSASGLLHPSKEFSSTGTSASIYHSSGMAHSPSGNKDDAVDTAVMGSASKGLHMSKPSIISDFHDSLDSCTQDLGSENMNTIIGGMVISPLHPPMSNLLNNNNFNSDDNGSCDLDQIDLPDGCVNVNVEHCTRQFFLANHKKSYPMRQIPRGLALIINVDEVEGKPPRKGTNFDRDNLCNLLCQLHFNIIVYNDKDGLSAQEMVIKLKEFAKHPDHAAMDACFVCLLSHGEEGFIFGTDGKRIPLEEIFMLFGNTNCRGLIGKPKVFIIQACRGGYLDKGVRMDEPDGGSVVSGPPSSSSSSTGSSRSQGPAQQQQQNEPNPQQLPSMSDMLVCYPTLTGYYAWRNRARGSWYIEAIVQVFMRYAKCEDICAMLNRVNQLVSKKVSECNQKEMNAMSQMSEYKSSLRQPHLFLFPGIGICMKPSQ